MKPTTKLLRGPRPAPLPTKVPAAKPEREVLHDRKRVLEGDARKLAAAAAGVGKRLDELLATTRRASRERPAPIAGHVVIRVLGATCDDRTPVPLPNLRVTLVGSDKTTATATTDVTGLALLPAPTAPVRDGDAAEVTDEGEPAPGTRPAVRARASAASPSYRLAVVASDGTEVARVEADPIRTHLITLGDAKGLEAHAALGRGWVAAIERAAKTRDVVVKKAEAAIAEIGKLNTRRLAAIEKRLGQHLK